MCTPMEFVYDILASLNFESLLANWACCLAGYKRVYHFVHSELVHLVPEIVQIQVRIEPVFMTSGNVSNLRLHFQRCIVHFGATYPILREYSAASCQEKPLFNMNDSDRHSK